MRRREVLEAGTLAAGGLLAGVERTAAEAATERSSPPPDRLPRLLEPDDPTAVFGLAARGRGEGVIELTMAAPTSDWERRTATSVTVEVAVDDCPTQQMVLFEGDELHTYRGFLGRLEPGRHEVTVRLRADLAEPATHPNPVAHVESVELALYPRRHPQHDAVAHAPVIYGREANTHSDVPLVSYYTTRPTDAGTRYRYTTVYSNEDGGGGTVPAYLMGVWGRATDIDWTAAVTVEDGALRPAETAYHACGHPLVSSEQTCLAHETGSFDGEYVDGHPVLRMASANGPLADDGEETPLRFQLPALGARPRPGHTREDVMDRQPFTYRVMDKELTREAAAGTTAPAPVFTYGDARQYVYAEVAGTVEHGSVAFDVSFVDDPAFYASDYTGTGPEGPVPPATFPFYTGGLGRTVIKAPRDADERALDAVRLRLGPAENPARNGGQPWNPAAAAATIESLRLFTLDEAYRPTDRFTLDAPVDLDAGSRSETRPAGSTADP
jgi:hypothetical protein